MSDLAVSFTFSANTTIVSAQANTNFSDIVTYINNRDDGTATWDNLNVTATVANPVTIKSSAATTEVAIDNTATTGDPEISFKLSGTAQFTMGVDDSVSGDPFIISKSGSLGTTDMMQFNASSIYSYQSFLVEKASAGDTLDIWINNTSNTASSDSRLVINVAGTSAGDAFILFGITSSTNWSIGLDNSASDDLVVAASATLGSSNALTISTAGLVTIPLGNLTLSRSNGGASVLETISNTSNTASSEAQLLVQVAGTSAGDASVQFSVSGTTTWTMGIDNSVANDPFILARSTALGTTNIIQFLAGSTLISNNLLVEYSTSGAQVSVQSINDSDTASSDAMLYAQVAGTSSGDAFAKFRVVGGSQYSIGVDNSDSDAFKISGSASLGTTDIIRATSTTFDPVGAGAISSGDGTNYWNDISYKTLTDRGCLPWCDDGVELMDGSFVSDLEALAQIQKHAEKQTIQGLPMLDYKTFPKKAYKQADNGGVILERDEKGEPIGGHDGVEMTMMFGVMIGAFKEIKQRLDKLEAA